MHCPCLDKFRAILTECQNPDIDDCKDCEIYQEICGINQKEENFPCRNCGKMTPYDFCSEKCYNEK
jgi:hypothetical protein